MLNWLFYSGAPEGTRTPDLLVRSQSLYPTELPAHTIRKCLNILTLFDKKVNTQSKKNDIFFDNLIELTDYLCYYISGDKNVKAKICCGYS